MDETRNVAIIPARGGSKRIPGKNVKLFAGKPIIAYSIQVALESGLFQRLIVSTDSEEIADVARKWGAEVPFLRPAEFSDDFTGTDEVILHALDWLDSAGEAYNYVCCIYATAPLLQAEYLRRGFQSVRREQAATAFSVTTYSYPIFRALTLDDNHRLDMIWPEHFTSRSQDLREVYHDAGQFYWAHIGKYRVGKRFFSNDAVPVIVPRHLVQDIDTEEDWIVAEKQYNLIV
ncbi:MAG: pseudaminic acid cytidylyltransferase [bacterium]|jgi:pseudaminic acid cytidylyltransferase|nr:pseudaminic acid cytidylyltransferase [bacterium]